MVAYWSQEPSEIVRALGATLDGLSSEDAAQRLSRFGPNEIKVRKRASRAHVLWRQIRSPLVLLLGESSGKHTRVDDGDGCALLRSRCHTHALVVGSASRHRHRY